jgi:hypothetical protein
MIFHRSDSNTSAIARAMMRRYGEEWFGRNTSSLREVPVDQLTVTEGTLQILEISQLASVREQLTPSALFGLELFAKRLK